MSIQANRARHTKELLDAVYTELKKAVRCNDGIYDEDSADCWVCKRFGFCKALNELAQDLFGDTDGWYKPETTRFEGSNNRRSGITTTVGE
jgi:hypothetical protein